ncbi:hypothetical protein ACKKBG_A27780 [Auxenochlorella protothecoides x Auxenochlorella symbiontica]
MDAKAPSIIKVESPCAVDALQKCLKANKGDHSKCKEQVEAFNSSCGRGAKWGTRGSP